MSNIELSHCLFQVHPIFNTVFLLNWQFLSLSLSRKKGVIFSYFFTTLPLPPVLLIQLYFFILSATFFCCFFKVDSMLGVELSAGPEPTTLRSRPELKSVVRCLTDGATQVLLIYTFKNLGHCHLFLITGNAFLIAFWVLVYCFLSGPYTVNLFFQVNCCVIFKPSFFYCLPLYIINR